MIENSFSGPDIHDTISRDMQDLFRHHPLPAGRRVSLYRIVGICACALVAAPPSLAQLAALAPTPSQTEGPFYPRTKPADVDADLTQVAGRITAAQGTRLYMTGRVLARDGRPIGNATVELWQADAHGRYHHAGDEGSPRDDNFQGFGTTTTDAEGRWAFKTIRPVPYTGRTPHLHVKARAPDGSVLTTQIYIKGDSFEGDPVLAWAPKGTREKLTMALSPVAGREPGALAGTYEIVLAQ